MTRPLLILTLGLTLGLGLAPVRAEEGVATAAASINSATLASGPDLSGYGAPKGMSEEVGAEAKIVDKRHAQLPLDAGFDNEAGKRVKLGDYFTKGRPVLVQFVYFRCPGLCNAVLNGTLEAITDLESMQIGQDYDLITISINPSETANLARAKKAAYLRELGRPEAGEGWHFLTGNKQEIRRVANAAGFGYRFDEESKEFAHGAALFVLTPEGKVSRTIYGAYYEEQTVRLSLVEAADGKIGSALDQILLFCYHFDPDTGEYTTTVMQLTRVFGVLLTAMIVTTIGGFLWLERRQRAREAAKTSSQDTTSADPAEDAAAPAGGSA
ncbi:MAG: SCO family protein [Planctomycetes bacterium]|nr:SCO family protein [Planctomycetota bacterium]